MDTIPGPDARSVALSPDGRHLHIVRALDTLHSGIVESASIIDTHTAPGFPLIGSLTTTGSTGSSGSSLPTGDGSTSAAGLVVALRGP